MAICLFSLLGLISSSVSRSYGQGLFGGTPDEKDGGIVSELTKKLTEAANKMKIELKDPTETSESTCDLEGAGVLAEPLSKSIFCMPMDDQPNPGSDCNMLQSCPDRPQSEGGGVQKLKPARPTFDKNEIYRHVCTGSVFIGELACDLLLEGADAGLACYAASAKVDESVCEGLIPPDIWTGNAPEVGSEEFDKLLGDGKIIRCDPRTLLPLPPRPPSAGIDYRHWDWCLAF